MTLQTNMYGVVHKKTPREIVLLNTVGGCSWHRCAFCEYCDTYSKTALEAEKQNKQVLDKVKGEYAVLQVMCSASFAELPMATWYDIRSKCWEKGIETLIVEMHWIHRDSNLRISEFFENNANPINVQFIYGIETFDFRRRETEWFKGYGNISANDLKQYADSVNLLIGVKGQTMKDIENDIKIAYDNFACIYINVFEPNDTPIERDWELMEEFYNSLLFFKFKDDSRVEILDGLDKRAPDNLGFVGVGPNYQ